MNKLGVYLASMGMAVVTYPVGIALIGEAQLHRAFLHLPWGHQASILSVTAVVTALGLFLTPYICKKDGRDLGHIIHQMGGCGILCFLIYTSMVICTNMLVGIEFYKAWPQALIVSSPLMLCGMSARAMYHALQGR